MYRCLIKMTKRKASVALDNTSEGNPNDGVQDGSSSSNNNNNNNNNSESGVTINNGGSSDIQPQNSTSASVISVHQHDQSNIQNDNSIGSNASGNNSVACGNQSQKGKKERSDNWSSAEIQVLHKGIESRRDIFYGPPSQATKKNRELAWDAITREVNSVSSTPRSLNQVMKKFKNEKCRAKRKFEPDKESYGNSDNSNSNNIHNTSSNNNLISNTNTNTNNISNSNHGDSSNARTNNGAPNSATSNTNLSAQNLTDNSQQQQTQLHHMTSAHQSMSIQQPSINVVKLAPQNVAKTMIDLPGHVQQIQMPNDDMVLIVPPDMDGLLSGVNIVSDGNGHHHFQKCASSNGK